MQKLAQLFAENFDVIHQGVAAQAISDSILPSNQKEFSQEVVEDLQKCKTLDDFVELKSAYYHKADAFFLLESAMRVESCKEKIPALRKWVYLEKFDSVLRQLCCNSLSNLYRLLEITP